MKQQFTFKSIFLFLFLGIISTTTYASHYYGSEITYNCLGSNQYEIILTTYTDCNSIGSPNSLTVNFSSATCTDFNQSLSLASGFPMDITPVCATQATSCNGGSGSIGISKYEYRGTVTLTGSCIDWLVSYNSCCRNNAITNVANPGSQSHFISASLNDGNLCNSSPKFIDEEPIKFGCTNSTMFVNVGATDADGDSLVYSLVAAQGSGGAALAYNVGHSATSPFTGNVTLNGSTGALEITANTAQTGHLVVQVNEYRSGALISEVRREVVYFFQNCTNSQPIVNQANGIAVNQGTIQFSVVAGTAWTAVLGTDDTEVNAGTQTLTATWGTLPGSATGSGSTTPTLNWTPTSNDVGTHYINLTVQDDACPIIGLNSYVVVVHVMPFSVGNTSSNVSATMAAGTTGDICFDLSNLTNPIVSVTPLGVDFNNATVNGVDSFTTFCMNVTADSLATDMVAYLICDNMGNCDTNFVTLTVEQGVWPGDTDVDQQVNHFDILGIGIAYNSTGAARTNASSVWDGYLTPDWVKFTANQTNYKHIDSNGDGIVDANDTLAITNNWGSTYTYKNKGAGGTIPFFVDASTSPTTYDVSLPIVLGNTTIPATDVYGLAFSIEYDTSLIKPNSVDISLVSSWLGIQGTDLISVRKDDYNEGIIYIGITRTDGMNISGSGVIGSLNFTIQDDIMLQRGNGGTLDFDFNIKDVKMIDSQENDELVSPQQSTLTIAPPTNTNNQFLVESIKVFPNPASGLINIKANNITIEDVIMRNMKGQVVKNQILNNNEGQINIESLPVGIYVISIVTKQGILNQKVSVLR
ncbi:MAG: T9SS type A sorting domain-containing protein [Saprospiraceae bacterium]